MIEKRKGGTPQLNYISGGEDRRRRDSLPRVQPGFMITTFLEAELSTVKGAVREELTLSLKVCRD